MSNAKRFIPSSTDEFDRELTVHDSVMAVKVTERNLISTKDWAAGFNDGQAEALFKVDSQGDTSDHRIRIKTPKGWRVARVGDYVVRHFNYGPDKPAQADQPIYFFSVGKDEFLENYTLSPKGYFV